MCARLCFMHVIFDLRWGEAASLAILGMVKLLLKGRVCPYADQTGRLGDSYVVPGEEDLHKMHE